MWAMTFPSRYSHLQLLECRRFDGLDICEEISKKSVVQGENSDFSLVH